MSEQEGITVKKSDNFSDWYNQVVQKAELADYAPVQGCMVIRPNGYAIWENIVRTMDIDFNKHGVKNVYFPQFIPESFLKKEAEHFQGFVPECAWVTIGGGTELGERLAVRPTSETIINYMFQKWIRSWRDLPLKINQWCNIVRWESATKFFVRTTEFLWQEGHTAHRTMEEADKMMMDILKVYKNFIQDCLAIPVLTGKKTEREKFAGALITTTLEALMPDGKALQMGTSHNLGQNFSKVFDIKFLDKDEKEKFVWTTSWGVSTRMIGGLIMTHENLKVILDDRTEYTPGWKFNEWELKGIPLRMEIGPKDVQKKQAVLVRRDNSKKTPVKETSIVKRVKETLNDIQKSLFKKAGKNLKEHITTVKTFDEFKKVLKGKGGFIRACHCLDEGCEEKIKDETGATIRLIPFKKEKVFSNCVYCSNKANEVVYFAKAY